MTSPALDKRIAELEREVAALPAAGPTCLAWLTDHELDQVEALYYAAECERRDPTAAEQLQITGIACLAEARRLAGEPPHRGATP